MWVKVPQISGRVSPCSNSTWILNRHPYCSSSRTFRPSSVRLAGRPPGIMSAADVIRKNGRGPLLIYTGMQYYWWKHFSAVCGGVFFFPRLFFLHLLWDHMEFPSLCVCLLWMEVVGIRAERHSSPGLQLLRVFTCQLFKWNMSPQK